MDEVLEKTIKKMELTLKELHKEYDSLDKMKEYNQEYRRWLEGNIYAHLGVLEYIYQERIEENLGRNWSKTN